MRFYKMPWTWGPGRTGRMGWRPPAGALWTLDLSANNEFPSNPTPGQQAGVTLIAGADNNPIGGAAQLLFQGEMSDMLTGGQANAVAGALRLGAPGGMPLWAVVMNGLQSESDPALTNAVGTLQPHGRDWRLFGPRNELFQTTFDINRADASRYRTLLQNEYLKVRAEAQAGRKRLPNGQPDLDFHRRWLTVLDEKLGTNNAQDYAIPPGEPKVTKLDHFTTHSDHFNGGAVLTWNTVDGSGISFTSNMMVLTGTDALAAARAEHDVSSSDNNTSCAIGDINLNPNIDGNCVVQACGRFASGAFTCYNWGYFGGTTLGWFWEHYRQAAGVEFGPIGGNASNTPVLGQVVLLEINGSSLTGKFNGSTLVATTDSNLASGTRGGVRMYKSNVSSEQGLAAADDYLIADASAPVVNHNLTLLGAGT